MTLASYPDKEVRPFYARLRIGSGLGLGLEEVRVRVRARARARARFHASPARLELVQTVLV